jgi:hypothetical protein
MRDNKCDPNQGVPPYAQREKANAKFPSATKKYS